MTTQQVKEVLRLARLGSVTQDMDDDKMKLMALHLMPLPFEYTRDRIHAYVAGHKWMGSLAELLDACGIDERARGDLVRAVRDGGQMVRDLRSMSGWSYVPVGAPLPQGAIEAAGVAARPTQSAPQPALPAGGEISEEQRRANLRRLAEMGRTAVGARPGGGPALPARLRRPEPPAGPTVAADALEADLAAYAERLAEGAG